MITHSQSTETSICLSIKWCNGEGSVAQQGVHITGGILRHFRALSTPEQNPALEVLSTPAHFQVTKNIRTCY